MSGSNNNISVKFGVQGSELSSFMDSVRKKQKELSNESLNLIDRELEANRKQREELDKIISRKREINRLDKERVNDPKYQAQYEYIKRGTDIQLRKAQGVYENGVPITEKRLEEVREKIFEREAQAIAKLDAKFSGRSSTDINLDGKEDLGIKEQKKLQREQLAEVKLQRQYLREQIENSKAQAAQNVAAIKKGDLKLEDVVKNAKTPQEKYIADLTKESLQGRARVTTGGGSNLSLAGLTPLMALQTLTNTAGNLAQIGQTQNGFDQIGNLGSLTGKILGGAFGAIIGSIVAPGAGTAVGGAAGATAGSELFGAFAASKQKEAILGQEFLRAKYGYTAATGFDVSSDSKLSDLGIDAIQALKYRTAFSRSRGYADVTGKTTRDVLSLEKGYGVDQSTSGGIIELLRSSKENNRDLAGLIGGVIEKGQRDLFRNGDITFLNEFLGKFTILQRELLKGQDSVASGSTMDILQQFNGLGGAFDARDPRSMGYISSISNSLANPSSDSMRAFEFAMLRRQMGGAGIFDMREEMQKGLGSPHLLKGMLEMVDRMGGDDQAKMMNLSGMFPGVPLFAIRRLFQNRGNLKDFSQNE